jgi:hypothetical protein
MKRIGRPCGFPVSTTWRCTPPPPATLWVFIMILVSADTAADRLATPSRAAINCYWINQEPTCIKSSYTRVGRRAHGTSLLYRRSVLGSHVAGWRCQKTQGQRFGRRAIDTDRPLHEYSDRCYAARTVSAPERSRSAADTVRLGQSADEEVHPPSENNVRSSTTSTTAAKFADRNIPTLVTQPS